MLTEEPNIVNLDEQQGQPQDQFHYNLLVRTRVKLNFTTVGRPSPELTLFKKTSNGVFREHNSPRFFVTFSGITISSVEPEDVGEYTLNAFSEGERDDEDFRISVISKFSVQLRNRCRLAIVSIDANMRCVLIASIVLFCVNAACGQLPPPCKLAAVLCTCVLAVC